MTVHREVRWTILIQGVGAVASLTTVVLLGIVAGPSVQGEFSRLKSALELVIAIAMLGAPQALLYFLRLKQITQRQIVHITLTTGLIGVACTSLYALIQQQIAPITLFLLASTTAAGTIHGVLRGAILASRSSSIFNTITILPQILLLPAVLIATNFSDHSSAGAILPFFFTWFLSAAIAFFFSRNIAPTRVANPISLLQLVNFSGASWLTTVLMSGTPALWLQYISTSSGKIDTGYFAMGMVGVQAVLTPINYATPLLFKHWTGRKNISPIYYSIRYGVGMGIIMLICVGIFSIPPHPIASEYAPLFHISGYFAAIATLESMIRISYVASIANGQPWHTVFTEFVRALCLAGILLLTSTSQLVDFAIAWMVACMCAAFACGLITWQSSKKTHILTP